ncbi:hypothetical protein ACHAWT_003647 [Skeletonema menzelii]
MQCRGHSGLFDVVQRCIKVQQAAVLVVRVLWDRLDGFTLDQSRLVNQGPYSLHSHTFVILKIFTERSCGSNRLFSPCANLK